MRIGRRRGCGINAFDRGHPRKFAAYGFIGWWNVFYLTGLTGSNINGFVDQFGAGNNATQATDANRAALSTTAWNGKPCADWGASGTRGYVTPSVSFGAHTFLMVGQGNASSGYAIVQTNDGTAGYIFGTDGCASVVTRSGVASGRSQPNWLRDGVKKGAGRTFNGTHAAHLLYVSGIDVAAPTCGTGNDPGLGNGATGPLYIGCMQTIANSFRGLWGELLAYRSAMPPQVVKRIFNRQRALWPM
ncbi:MAG TPA: hypothetical protein VK550_12350 [Polyangiaceae bacterium]|nr:hypothetical protein [Polyangiaceae bacterium]